MSKKSQKVEDIVEAVQDEKGMEILCARLYTRLEPLIKNLFAELAAEFRQSLLATVNQTVTEVVMEAVLKSNEAQNHKISVLEQEVRSQNLRIDDMETHSRLDNLIIHGLPEPHDMTSQTSSSSALPDAQSTRTEFLNVCRDRLGLNLLDSDISTAHRIRRSGRDASRPIIVRFTSRDTRDSVFRARKALRSSSSHQHSSPPIYINEHLTQRNAQIYSVARKLAKEGKIHSTWTAGGFTFLRHSSSAEVKAKRIRCIEELDIYSSL